MINKLMDPTAQSQSLLESGESHLISPVETAGNSNGTLKYFITALTILVLGGVLVGGVSCWLRVPLIIEPEIYIGNFHVPALDVASKDTTGIINTGTVTFDLSFENLNPKQLQIFYDTVDINLYYYGSNSGLPVGNISIPEFDQGNIYPTLRVETIVTYGLSWEDARKEISEVHEAVFRVDLYTKYWSSNELSRGYGLRVGTNVTVNDHGLKSVKQRLKLSS